MAAGHAQIQKPHAAADARLEWSSFEPVHTGMPHLCRAGLSENWLLKACGHRHWMALALAHGQAVPDFRDSDDQRLYPAFVSVAVEAHGDGLGSIGENVLIDFRLVLEREARTALSVGWR
jgi:probable biosynthetic protein (TIGR04098 family)